MDETREKLPLLFKCFRDSLVGKNTKGIIHNINSPLQVLSMQMELLRMDCLKLKDRLRSGDASPKDLEALMDKSIERLAQVEEVVQKINHQISVIGARVSETDDHDQGTPVMLNQLLEEHVEFWKADLFFKHKVELSMKLPEISPVVVMREDLFRNVMDGIIFSCLEQIRNQPEPRMEIKCIPGSEGVKNHKVIFSHSGPAFAVDEIAKLFERFSQMGADDFSAFETIPLAHFSLLLADISAILLGSSMDIEARHVICRL